MTTKANFNADEWSKVLEAPPLAGVLVATAERGGTLREAMSMGKVYTAAREKQGENELLDEIVSSQPQLDTRELKEPGELKEKANARLREVVSLLEQKAGPDDVQAYKEFVMKLADTVARSHSEGGFMGFGRTEVSEKESAVLDELASTLGVERPAA